MIRTHRYASKFKSDYKRESRGHHGRKLDEWLDDAISLLLRNERLPEKYCDHELLGDWKGYRDCHLAPDLLLIYRKLPDVLLLVRLGSHFGNFRLSWNMLPPWSGAAFFDIP